MDYKFKNLSILYPEEGARAKFENLVAQALCAAFPGTHQIRATRGDRGIDVFQGALRPDPDGEAEPLKIFQCKYFPDRIDASRRRQVKESLVRARECYPHLDTWVLCVPCKLSNEETEWWERLQKEEGAGLHLELYDENILLRLLRGAELINELAVEPPEKTLAAGMVRGGEQGAEGGRHFVGRERELAQIRGQFERGKNVVVLNGIAGIGKSELAKYFFEVSGDLFYYAQFIFIDEKSPMRQDEPKGLLQMILQRLRFSLAFERSCIGLRPENQLRLRQSALAELTQTALLIIDNANDLTERDLKALLDFPCRFLITTRKRIDLKDNDRIGWVPVEEMSSEDLIRVFEKKYGPAGEAMRPGLEKLFKKIDRHTMTVELVATLMRSQGMELHEILDTMAAFDKSDARINYSHNDSKQENVTILEHLQALFDLSQTTEEEASALRSLALVANCGIDSETLKAWLGLKNNNVLLSLAEKGWIRYSPGEQMVQLHSLISRLCFVAFPPALDACGGLIRGIKALMQFEGCTMMSEVQAIMTYGEFLAGRLEEAGLEEPELLVCLANGYAILGETEKSRSLALALAEQPAQLVPCAQAVILVGRLGLNQFNYGEVASWYEENRLRLTAPEQWKQRAILLMQLGDCYHELNDMQLTRERLVECFDLYIKHESVVGAGAALIKILQCCKCSTTLRRTLLRRFKRLCYKKAGENPFGLLLYTDCRVLSDMRGDNWQFSSAHQMVDELIAGTEKTIPWLRLLYNVRRQQKILRKCGDTHMADMMETLFCQPEEDYTAWTAAIWEMQSELTRQGEMIGLTIDVFNAWVLLLDCFPGIDLELVLPLMEDAFREYEKRLFVSYYNVIPVLVGYARVKGLTTGAREGVAQLECLIELQIKMLPPKNQCHLVTTYEALGDMYSQMGQRARAKDYYKMALKILREVDAAPSELARFCYKLDYSETALELLEGIRMRNCLRCRVYQDLGAKARRDGDLEKMLDYYRELRRNARKFKGCVERCYAEVLVECGDSIARTSRSGLAYYIRAYLIGRQLRRPFARETDNCYYLARLADRRGAKGLVKGLVIYGLDCGIKRPDTKACQQLLCFYIENNWDGIWKKYAKKTPWRLYRKRNVRYGGLLSLLLQKYLRKSSPLPFEYAKALRELYEEHARQCGINSYTGSRELIVIKLLNTREGQALIESAESGKRLLCDAQEYIMAKFLCETPSMGLLPANGELNAFERFARSMQEHMERGEICAAEDLLFAYREEHPIENLDLVAEKFYEQLEGMSDEELAAADFSREEISEGHRDFARFGEARRR